MADLSGDIRLAVDSGKSRLGIKSVIESLNDGTTQLVIVASSNREGTVDDIGHLAKISGKRVMVFKGNPRELGSVCGKPFPISALSILDPGNSKILESREEVISAAKEEPAEAAPTEEAASASMAEEADEADEADGESAGSGKE